MNDTRREKLHTWVKPENGLPIGIYQYGYETCSPSHHFGPAVRDHFLLHFVKDGSGVFSTENRSYPLTGGTGFLIFPESVTAYRADKQKPWSYHWIGVMGEGASQLLQALGLSKATPVFRFSSPDRIGEIFHAIEKTRDRKGVPAQLSLVSSLYALLSEIRSFDPEAESDYRLFNTGKDYVEFAVLHIRQCYASHITVGGIAEQLGLERTYFSSVFKKHTGYTPKEYLTALRLEKAKELLLPGRLSVADVARTVGYEDPLLFSRIFSAAVGCSPRAFRKKAIEAGGDTEVKKAIKSHKNQII